jgi:hypothetical protein
VLKGVIVIANLLRENRTLLSIANAALADGDNDNKGIRDPRSFAGIDAFKRESNYPGKGKTGEAAILLAADFCGGNGEMCQMPSNSPICG